MEEVLVFPSTYHMLRSEELLKRRGFRIRLVPAPPRAGELCTTAIAVSSGDRDEIVRCLEEEKILIKAVVPHEDRLERSLASALAGVARERVKPGPLGRMMEAIRAGKRLEAAGIEELLAMAEGEEAPAVVAAAEAVARAYFGGRVVAAAALRLGTGSAASGARPGLEEVAAVVEEMRGLGFVHLLLDLGDMEDIPWQPGELKDVLGDEVVVVMTASSLPRQAGGMVREGLVRQFLLRRRDVFTLDAAGLAEEIVFLRDNRPGPVGSGNLVPLPGPDPGEGREGGLRRLRAVIAACRLTLGDAFLPAPPSLWRTGGLAGANLLVLDASAKPLAETAREAEEKLREGGMRLVRAGRKGMAAG